MEQFYLFWLLYPAKLLLSKVSQSKVVKIFCGLHPTSHWHRKYKKIMTNNEAKKEKSADSVFMTIDIFVYAHFFF